MPRVARRFAKGAALAGLVLAGGAWAASSDEIPKVEEAAQVDETAESDAAEAPTPFAETAAAQPPIGVDDARALPRGTVRVSYRYARRYQHALRIGDHRESSQRARADQAPPFSQLPRKRTLQEHLVGLSWAPFSRLTLAARLPIYLRDEQVDLASGARYETRTEGIGDLRVMALVPFMKKGRETLLVGVGFQAPTGSNRRSDAILLAGGSEKHRLAYPMQPGEGSWAVVPTATYQGFWRWLSWGLQYEGVFFVDENREGYRPGTRHQVSTWAAWGISRWLSSSVRFKWHRRNNIHGGDEALGGFPYPNPNWDSKRHGGQWLLVGPGLNFRLPCCGGQRLAIEALFPIWQELDGPQLEDRWILHAGVQLDF